MSYDEKLDVDSDKKYIIKKMFLEGKNFEDIAKTLKEDVDVVKKVIRLYKKRGQQAVRNKDWRQAAFWYLIHMRWLEKERLAVYKTVVRKVDDEYPGFMIWLEAEKTINEQTTWEEVLEKNQKYREEVDEFAQDRDLEAEIGMQGANLIPVEQEEQIISSVCDISVNGERCDGIFIERNGVKGILTTNTLLKDEKVCQKAKVLFEDFEEEYETTLTPDECFIVSKDLNVIFVSFKKPENFDISPLQDFQSVSEIKSKASCHSCFFKDKEKFLTNSTISGVNKTQLKFNLDKNFAVTGAPVFISTAISGFVSREKNKVDSFDDGILKWLDSNLDAPVNKPEITAKWTDGFFYPAVILKKTANGYRVHFYQYGDGDDVKIEVNEDDVQIPDEEAKEDEVPNDEWKKVLGFLKDSKLDKYIKKFEDNGLNNLGALHEMHKNETLRKKLEDCGFKHGARLKVIKAMDKNVQKHSATYLNKLVTSNDSKNQIKEILNTAMPDNFEPGENDKVLDDQFKVNGKISIRSSLQKIAKLEIDPRGVTPDHPFFYLYSTNKKRFFKITLIYED